MKILITGGLGYMGGRVASHLRDTLPGSDIHLAATRVHSLPAWTEGFHVSGMDVRDPESVRSCVEMVRPDVIIHLAALNDAQSAADPVAAMDVNVLGTYRVLECAKRAGTRKFIYVSTIHVYGPVLAGELTEDSPAFPVHPYAITHRSAEDWVGYFRRYHGMRTLILRVSNGYGCPMDENVNAWTLVFNDLCRQLVTAGRIVLRSSGRQRRDFISLGDVAGAMRHFLVSAPDAAWDRLYNIGSGTSISILEAAERVRKVYRVKYGADAPPVVAGRDVSGAAEGDMEYNVRRAAAAGFVPKGDSDAEIERTLAFCERFRSMGADAR